MAISAEADMTTTDPAPGWHPDPFGRHQFRWWGGTQWSETVSDDGVQSVDPPVETPAPSVPTVEGGWSSTELLQAPRIFFQAGGNKSFPPGWWAVHDEQHRHVAQLWRQGKDVGLYDAQGNRMVGVRAHRQRGRPGNRSDVDWVWFLTDSAGADCANVLHVQAMDSSLRLKYADSKLKVKVDTTSLGTDMKRAVIDVDKRQVGTITPVEPGPTPGTNWLFLDRDPSLTDSAAFLCLAAPLLAMSLVYRIDG
jgi:hypothetical protein